MAGSSAKAVEVARRNPDRKSTRLNSSHANLVCRLLLEKKKEVQSGLRENERLCERGTARQASLGCILGPRRPGLQSFFFNDTARPEIYPLSLHDALPI